MTSEPIQMPEEPSARATSAPASLPFPRIFAWSVRREIWESRAVYLAPLAAAGVALLGVLASCYQIPQSVRLAMADPKKVEALMLPYAVVAFAVLLTGVFFAVFYSAAALHGERRDRSILFWKSLPVSDLAAVLAKAAIPLLVLPPVMLAVIYAGHAVVLVLTSLVVAINGIDPRELWGRLSLGFMWAALARGMIFLPLWYAPVLAWLILVSSWARRMPLLWALAPVIGIPIIERLAVGKHGWIFTAMISRRLGGGLAEAFSVGGKGKTPIGHWADLDPTRFLTNPEVWLGLVVAGLFLAAAIRLRRAADPI
jgi:ABC-2 type transport system permease protein